MNLNNKNEMIEKDDMNIKGRLNNSLDLSGIQVSEELINRTLTAIKEQSAKVEDNKEAVQKENKKVITWNRYARGFAGVAAAALIIAVGYGAVSQMTFINKEKSNSTQSEDQYSFTMEAADEVVDSNTTATDGAKAYEDNGSDTTASVSAKTSATNEASQETEVPIQRSIAADISEIPLQEEGTYNSESITGLGAEDAAVTAATDKEDTDSAETEVVPKGISMATLIQENEDTVYNFRDIFLSNPDQAEYITITDEVNQITVKISSSEDIIDFYSVMDNQQFTIAAEELTQQNYTIEVKVKQTGELYILMVGNSVTERYQQGDIITDYSYDDTDETVMKQELDKLISKYNQ